MTAMFRNVLEGNVDLSNISDADLKIILDEIGRGAIYNYLLLGKDYTYERFIDHIESYLELNKHIDNK